MSKTKDYLLDLFERTGNAPALIVNKEVVVPFFDGDDITFQWISTQCDADAYCSITQESWMATVVPIGEPFNTISVEGLLAGEHAEFEITLLKKDNI
jgi:hypothetical protein